jgi:molybdopterin converting factor small subunit
MKVLIPTPLRDYTEKQAVVELSPGSVHEVLRELTSRYPDLRKQLFGEDGRLRKFVNVYVNDEDIRHLENENTQVRYDDTLSIIPSVAGGCFELDRNSCQSPRDFHLRQLSEAGRRALRASSSPAHVIQGRR